LSNANHMAISYRLAAVIGCLAIAGLPATAQPSVTYQINAAHSGETAFPGGLKLPLEVAWSRTFPYDLAYPVIADGRIFVNQLSRINQSRGTIVEALDPASGNTLWRRRSVTPEVMASQSTYDGGRLFVLDNTGMLTAHDPATGNTLWRRRLPFEWTFDAAPTPANGRIYVGGCGMTGYVYAVDQLTGRIDWKQGLYYGSCTSPTVSPTTVFASYSCQLYTLDAATGQLGWHFFGECVGGGRSTAVLHRDRVYKPSATTSDDQMYAFNAESGKRVQIRNDIVGPPVFLDGIGYFWTREKITALNLSPREKLWDFKFTRDAVELPPIIVNGYLIVTSLNGDVWVVNSTTGEEIQHISLGLPVTGMGSASHGLAAGEGLILIPAGKTLFALKGAAN
jgi:outer membrane protein assembly factor BamB